MNELRNCDSMLKRFLKRKVKVTDALIVAFLITGGIGFAASPDQPGQDTYNLSPGNPIIAPTLDPDNAQKTVNSGWPYFNWGILEIDPEKSGGIATTNNKVATNAGIIQGEGYGMLASGGTSIFNRSRVYNTGIIQNTGDVGMGAINGGYANNLGVIRNIGNFGMVADGDSTSAKNSGPLRSTAVNFYFGKILGDTDDGNVKGVNNVGMAAFGNAIVANEGFIANSGVVGMYAENGATAVNKGSDYKKKSMKTFNGGGSEDRKAGIYNDGDYGMIANAPTAVAAGAENPDFTLAANFGLVANNGDYGMVASNAGALALNIGHHEGNHLNRSKGEGKLKGNGVIANKGDFGMAALEGGVAINTGRIENIGDVGMIADGLVSIAVNSSKPLGKLLNGEGGHSGTKEQSLTGQIEHKLDGFTGPGNQGNEPVSGIYNEGNFGMVAQNKAIAINDGIIANTGNVGMLVYDQSLGVNTKHGVITPEYNGVTGDKVGVFVLGGSAFVNNGRINADDGYAIYGGSGNNAIYLGTDSDITGRVDGSGGTNTLYFIAGEPEADKDITPSSEPIIKNIGDYGNIKAETFAHIGVAAGRYVINDAVPEGTGKDIDSALGGFSGEYDKAGDNNSDPAEYTLNIDRVMNMRASSNGKTGAGYDGDSSGYLKYDKFNSFQTEGKEIDDYQNGGRFTGDLVINGATDGEGNVIKEGNIILKLAQNRVSTIAANSLNTVIPESPVEYATRETEEIVIPTDGKVTQRSFDEFFVTNANKIEVKNILLNTSDVEEDATGVEKLSDKEYRVTTGTSNFILTFDNVPENWVVSVQVNDDGSISSIYTKIGSGLPGGYGESIERYTQSNVDIINSQRITDTGYAYARKAAFLPEEKTIVQETVALPARTEVVKQGKEMVALPSSTPEISVIDKVESKRYNNLQFADIFGEWGKYDGNTNAHYDYDTWGITGASFHRFDQNWLGGLSYGYAKSDVDYSKGSEKVDTLGINGLVSYQEQNWLLTGNLGYSWNRHKLNRHAFNNDALEGDELITVGENYMNAKFDSHMFTLGAELGYNYLMDSSSSLYPYVGLDYSWYNRDSYREHGGPDLALAIDKTKYDFATSKLGIMYEKNWDKYSFTADLGWKHNFLDNKKDADTYGNFYNKGSSAKFQIPGLDIGKDVGYITLAVNYAVSPQFTVGADYTGYTRSKEFGNKVGINLQYKW